jgi:hypothetical protein
VCGVPHQILGKRPFLPSSARGAIALGPAAANTAKAAAGGLWHAGQSGQCKKGAHTRMRLCCLYICCSLLTVCVLLSASRDEEVVLIGQSQVRQPGGEFNCPRVSDQRQDRERIKAFLHRDLGCRRGIPAAGGTIVWLLVKLDDKGLSVSYLSPLFHTLSVQFLIPLSLSLCFLPPSSLPQAHSLLSFSRSQPRECARNQ